MPEESLILMTRPSQVFSKYGMRTIIVELREWTGREGSPAHLLRAEAQGLLRVIDEEALRDSLNMAVQTEINAVQHL